MYPLQTVQLWEIMRARQAELLKEAEMRALANKLDKPKVNWWKILFRRPEQAPAPVLQPNATPELG